MYSEYFTGQFFVVMASTNGMDQCSEQAPRVWCTLDNLSIKYIE